MIKKIGVSFIFLFILFLTYANDKFLEVKKDKFILKYRYTDNTIDIILTGETNGWIGIGFNPSLKMKDANFIIGYVKDKILYIEDHFGTSTISHNSDIELGGTNDFFYAKGIEIDGKTEISFSMKRKSSDKFDNEIKKGKNTIILAMGLRDDFKSKHVNVTVFDIVLK